MLMLLWNPIQMVIIKVRITCQIASCVGIMSLYIHIRYFVSSYSFGLVWCIVFNATLNNISVISRRSVLLVKETRVLGENHLPVASDLYNFGKKYIIPMWCCRLRYKIPNSMSLNKFDFIVIFCL